MIILNVMLNCLNVMIRYESEIESLREVQMKQEKLLKEQNTILLEKCSDELKKQFEAMSEHQHGEYAIEKAKMEREMTELKDSMNELRRQFDVEVNKSNEKSNELIALNKQKFKLMAQVKKVFKKLVKK